jgi:hypothetical protein
VNTLIGLRVNPPGGSLPLFPVGGRTSTADRLRLFLGLSVTQYLRTFPVRLNLLDEGVRIEELRRELRGSVFVLGREPWRLLGLPRRGWFGVEETEGAVWVLIPHPSGRSIVYNSKSMRERAKRVVYKYLEQEETDHERRSYRGPPSGNRGGSDNKKARHSISVSMDEVLGEAK